MHALVWFKTAVVCLMIDCTTRPTRSCPCSRPNLSTSILAIISYLSKACRYIFQNFSVSTTDDTRGLAWYFAVAETIIYDAVWIE